MNLTNMRPFDRLLVLGPILAVVLFSVAIFGTVKLTVAAGTHYWVATTGSDAVSCVNSSGDIDPGAGNYRATPQAGAACLTTAGARLTIKTGTYTTGAKINENESLSVANGTAGLHTIIEGEGTVGCAITHTCGTILRPASGTLTVLDAPSYITIRRLEIDSTTVEASILNCVYLAGAGTDILFEDVEFHHCGDNGVGKSSNAANVISNITMRRVSFHDNGKIATGFGKHGTYLVQAPSVLIEYSKFYDNGAGCPTCDAAGVQMWTNTPNSIVRYSIFSGNEMGMNYTSSSIQIYNNLFYGNTRVGLEAYGGGNDGAIHNNGFYNNTGTDISLGPFVAVTGTVIKNNWFFTTPSAIDASPGTPVSSFTGTHNACAAGAECGSTGKVTLTALTDITVSTSNFTHKVGSTGINAGTPITGFNYNGSAPDIGPFETFGFSTASINENSLDVTLGLSLNTAVTGLTTPGNWTVNNGRTVTASALLVGSSSIVRLTISGAACVAESWTVAYTAGSVTDSALVGYTTNQPLFTFTAQSVTNACGSSPPPDPGTPWVHLSFNDAITGTTPTTTQDSSANNLDGTLNNGTTYVPGKFGGSDGAVNFVNGGTQTVSVPYGNAVNPSTQSLTVCADILPDAGLESAERVAVSTDRGTSQRFYIGWTQGTWGIGIQASAFSLNSEFPVAAGRSFVCVVADSGTDIATLYVNGIAGTSAQSVKAYTSYALASDFVVGTLPTFTHGGMTVGQLKIYKAALTAADILDLYEAWEPASPPIVGTVSQVAHQWQRLRRDLSLAVENYGTLSATMPVIVGGAVSLVIQTDCTGANCSAFGASLRYNVDGGAFLAVPDLMGVHVGFFGTPDIDVFQGVATCCLTGALTVNHGTTNTTMASVPVNDLTQNSSVVQRYVIKISSNATAGTVYCFKLYDQTGSALAAYTPTAGACMTMIGISGAMGF